MFLDASTSLVGESQLEVEHVLCRWPSRHWRVEVVGEAFGKRKAGGGGPTLLPTVVGMAKRCQD